MFYRRIDRKELTAIHRYPRLEALVGAIEEGLVGRGLSGPGPPSILSAEWLIAIAEGVARHCEGGSLGRFSVSQLWFLALQYIDVRGSERYRHELSDDDVAFLSWFLDDDVCHHEDDVLTIREHMLMALRERNMWAPRHFYPLLNATA
jgi:hypothetical protein